MPRTDGTGTPVSSSRRSECWSWRWERSRPKPRPPWVRTQREHWPAPLPTSSTSSPVTSPRTCELVLGVALGAPHEARVTEEGAVGGLVLVGVAVPVGAVGAARLPLGDGAPLDPDGLRQVVVHPRSVVVPDATAPARRALLPGAPAPSAVRRQSVAPSARCRSSTRGSRGPDRMSAGLDLALISAPSRTPPLSVSHLVGSVLAFLNRLLALPVFSTLSFRPSRSVSFFVGFERVLPMMKVPFAGLAPSA